jgi:hypothetical protein
LFQDVAAAMSSTIPKDEWPRPTPARATRKRKRILSCADSPVKHNGAAALCARAKNVEP